MPLDATPPDIDPTAKNIIRRKARQLARADGISSSDLPDIEQDLSLHLWKRSPAFDPRRGDWTAFVAAVVTTWGANFVRDRQAAMRDHHRARPLRTAIEPDGQERGMTGELLDGEAHDRRLGRHRLSDQEQRELQLDVQQAMQGLPSDLRPIAERLQHLTIAELARELGVPRTTLCESIKRIRRRFQKMGLGKIG